jgi:capsid protein
MWRIDSLGIRAEDFINKDGNPVNDCYGHTWKMADPADHAKLANTGSAEVKELPAPKALVDGDSKYTEAELETMNKVQLSEIAASLGVSDMTMQKSKMIQVILTKQG